MDGLGYGCADNLRRSFAYPAGVSSGALSVESGYSWEDDPAHQGSDGPGMNPRKTVRAKGHSEVTAIAKFPPRQHPEDIYGIGMERVASRLGKLLKVPVPEVWLEEVDGQPAAVVRRIPQVVAWVLASPDVRKKIQSKDDWPISVVFDVWIANYDRWPRNLLFQPLPEGTHFSSAASYRLWLIDHGLTGLLWAQKFDLSLGARDIEHVDVGQGDMLESQEKTARAAMPREYKDSFWSLEQHDRAQVLDRVRKVPDDEIDQIIDEIPDAYMNGLLRENTKALLKGRRDRIDSLMGQYWA